MPSLCIISVIKLLPSRPCECSTLNEYTSLTQRSVAFLSNAVLYAYIGDVHHIDGRPVQAHESWVIENGIRKVHAVNILKHSKGGLRAAELSSKCGILINSDDVMLVAKLGLVAYSGKIVGENLHKAFLCDWNIFAVEALSPPRNKKMLATAVWFCWESRTPE